MSLRLKSLAYNWHNTRFCSLFRPLLEVDIAENEKMISLEPGMSTPIASTSHLPKSSKAYEYPRSSELSPSSGILRDPPKPNPATCLPAKS